MASAVCCILNRKVELRYNEGTQNEKESFLSWPMTGYIAIMQEILSLPIHEG